MMESRVLIIMTGGTICMRPSAEGLVVARDFLTTGMASRPSFNDGSRPEPLCSYAENSDRDVLLESLRTPVSRYGRHVRYAILEFQQLLDSSSIDATGWAQIARTIQKNYSLFDGFVVLHGTDSLAYTSSALSFMLSNLGKTVILTGSQASIHELQNDATDNLLGSLIIAGHFPIPEVCLFFNHKLFRGNRATKISADHFAAFDSPNFVPLATITSSHIHVAWEAINRPTELQALDLQTNLELAHVACLRVFPGIKPEMVAAVLAVPGLRGLILETFGAGNAPSGPDNALITIFTEAVQRGIVIINVTQCLTGSVSPLYAPAMVLGKAGIVAGGDMTTEAALTKLSYLLAQSHLTQEDVVRMMPVSLRGELTESDAEPFNPYGNGLSGTFQQSERQRLVTAIGAGDLHLAKEITSFEPCWHLNDPDRNGNTPLHVAATGPSPEVLKLLLQKGASVHLRNKNGRTPLFVAAQAQRSDHVSVLRRAGAHLHPDELSAARRLRDDGKDDRTEFHTIWKLARLPD